MKALIAQRPLHDYVVINHRLVMQRSSLYPSVHHRAALPHLKALDAWVWRVQSLQSGSLSVHQDLHRLPSNPGSEYGCS
jgi:hypothetical protein